MDLHIQGVQAVGFSGHMLAACSKGVVAAYKKHAVCAMTGVGVRDQSFSIQTAHELAYNPACLLDATSKKGVQERSLCFQLNLSHVNTTHI